MKTYRSGYFKTEPTKDGSLPLWAIYVNVSKPQNGIVWATYCYDQTYPFVVYYPEGIPVQCKTTLRYSEGDIRCVRPSGHLGAHGRTSPVVPLLNPL